VTPGQEPDGGSVDALDLVDSRLAFVEGREVAVTVHVELDTIAPHENKRSVRVAGANEVPGGVHCVSGSVVRRVIRPTQVQYGRTGGPSTHRVHLLHSSGECQESLSCVPMVRRSVIVFVWEGGTSSPFTQPRTHTMNQDTLSDVAAVALWAVLSFSALALFGGAA